MEQRRFILLALLGVVLFFMYQAWQKDFAPAPLAPAADNARPPPDADDLPQAASAPAAGSAPAPAAAAADLPAPPAAGGGTRIVFETDVMRGEIATQGGELRRLELKGYPVSKTAPDVNLALLDDRADRYFVLQSGLVGREAPLATHKSSYTAEHAEYRLADGAEQLDVTLSTTDARGFTVRKTYRFHRGAYNVELIHQLVNQGSAPLAASQYARLVRTPFKAGDEPPFVQTFTGVGFYEHGGGTRYTFQKTALDELAETPLDKTQAGGWIALLQHYFVAAIIPPQAETLTFSAKPAHGVGGNAQFVGPAIEVAPGGEQVYATALYLGPKLQSSIGRYAPGLELTVDYGILTAISEPLFWLLELFHTLTGNWGFAIILLTLAVKAAMYKLSEAQYRSMAKMKRFAPKIQDIKERYGDDRERMQKAMMELYKKEGFNPLAGCWPLLVQFPVFIALYWVLLESVELRQAPFALWLNDLSSPDPYFVLPVLFGISMFVQQKLSGQQMPDPMQQKIMNVMPIMLSAFFAFFQSGLVLYWLVSNLIGIAQQWYITRKLEREGLASKR